LCTLHHERPNAHAETLLPLVEQLLAETGSARSSLDRLAVGIGPGSFTGLRVGIALAQGMALGLDRPLVGIGSLRAVARGAPEDDPRVRVVALDARRDELFVAAYAADGRELLAPAAFGRDVAPARVAEALAGAAALGLGELARELGPSVDPLARDDLDLPHARWVALLGVDADPSAAVAEPNYVRGPGATLPNLPPSPLRAE
jgi:tRNA threonylcarbamoyladenosine biosynthesis protein TsaB